MIVATGYGRGWEERESDGGNLKRRRPDWEKATTGKKEADGGKERTERGCVPEVGDQGEGDNGRSRGGKE